MHSRVAIYVLPALTKSLTLALSRTVCTRSFIFCTVIKPVCGIPVHVMVDGLDLVPRSLKYRGGLTQLVERGTEKPGAILTRVRFPVAARDFLSRVIISVQFVLQCMYEGMCAKF